MRTIQIEANLLQGETVPKKKRAAEPVSLPQTTSSPKRARPAAAPDESESPGEAREVSLFRFSVGDLPSLGLGQEEPTLTTARRTAGRSASSGKPGKSGNLKRSAAAAPTVSKTNMSKNGFIEKNRKRAAEVRF